MQQKNNKLFLILFLGTLSAFGPFVTDLYLPALPVISQVFSASTSVVQLTLTTSMVGLAIGQLLIGPISDKFGRKKPLTISLIAYIVSTILIIYSPNIYGIILFRLIQGLAAAGSLVISKAVSTDLYKGEEMRKFFGLLMAVNGLAPIISPIFGSFILSLTSWKAIFIVLALLGIILLVVNIKLYESLPIEKRLTMPVIKTYSVIGTVIKNKKFTTLVFILAFTMGAMFAYIAASPFILQEHYGLSATLYSLFFAINGAAVVIGSNISSKIKEKKSLNIGLSLILLLGLYISLALITNLNVWMVEIGFFFLMLGVGFIFPAVSSLAMSSERKYVGSASALLGFFPFLFCGIVSPLVGIANIFYATSITIVSCATIAYLLFILIKKNI